MASSTSKMGGLEGKLKEAEEKIDFLEKISELEAEVKKAHTEKISRLELQLKESLQAKADYAAKLRDSERRLQFVEQRKREYETSFNAAEQKFLVASGELEAAKKKISKNAIAGEAKDEMIRALHIICGKNDRIRVIYEGTLSIAGWHSSTEHKFKNGKTYSDFKMGFWYACQSRKTFDHLLKLDYVEGTLKYVIHDANEEIAKLRMQHPLMATRVENMYLTIVLWNIEEENLTAIPWNSHTEMKATGVEILDFILEVITSKYKRVKKRW